MSTAAVIIIGNEILSGKFADENGPYFIRRMRTLGIDLLRIVTVADDHAAIADEVRRCAASFDHVFTTGGVGPTHDDITFEGVAAGLGLPLHVNAELLALARSHGFPEDAGTTRMASLPVGTELLTGPAQPFPVLRIRNVYVLPGIPALVKQQFEFVAPALAGDAVHCVRVYARNLESEIAVALAAVAAAHPAVAIGSYPRFGEREHRLVITLEGRDPAALAVAVEEVRTLLDTVRVDGP